MIKKIIKFLLVIMLLFPIGVYALSDKYDDLVYDVVGVEKIDEKINIYFFFGDGCPHCENEKKFLTKLEDKYHDDVNIYMMEVTKNEDNKQKMLTTKQVMKDNVVVNFPYTVVGNTSFVGYNDEVGIKIENQIKEYLGIISEEENIVMKNKTTIPLIGEIEKDDVSIGFVAIVLGFVDGFNPCAMWILLFLINMLIGMNDKRKMLIIGSTFLLTSGIMYFLFMLGITNILSMISISIMRKIIGIIAVSAGVYNVYRYFKEKNKDDGCHVVDEKKRKKIFTQMRKFTSEKNIFLALIGVIALAISVNVIELACSSVFPATFAEILAVNNVTGISKYIYLIIYTLFYMIDDFIVFVIAVATLQISTTSSKYGKYSSIVGGIIMLIIGILLIIKPEWLMLSF